MSNWSDIIAAHTTGTLSYTFTPSINATIKCYARLLSDDYTGQAIYRLSDEAGTHYVQLEGQTSNTMKLVEYPGASVLITDIPVLHNTWQMLVLVVTLTQVHIYQNGVLINSGFLANPLQVASMLFYNTTSQLYDELVHIPSVVSTEQIERWQEQEWPMVTADPGGSYEEQYALGTLAEPTGTWSSSPPVVDNGEYLWMRKRWVEGDGTPGDWSTPVRIKGDTGESGAPARAINLYASSNVINFSSRGELKTQQIEITCLPSNLPISDAVWTATDEGSLSQIEIAEGVFDQYRRILDCSLVTGDSTLISVSITYAGETYTGVVGITKVADSTPSPLYLDAQSSVPTLTTEGPLIVGDFFLYVGAYSGPNSDPGDQGLNPPALEINEFVYGRIYEYRGKDALDVDQWQESRKSEHLAAAQKDALQIAKDSNTYMFVAVLVAQLGLFFDLIVAGVLKSPNYAENASGVPTAGFKLDGLKGLIKALGLEAYEAMIYGNLQASGFKTLQEEPGTTIATVSITPTIWKHSEMEALIASQDSLATLSGTIDGYSFNKATRRLNQRVLLASHGYESEPISAGESHLFTVLTPSQVFSPNSFYCEYSGYYKGNFSFRYYYIFLDVDEIGYAVDELGTSYTVAKNYSIPWPRDGQPHSVTLFVRHYSMALFDFGAKPSHVDYHRVWTSEIFSGLVLVNGELSYKVISPKPTAYYTTAKTWTIGSYNQNSIANYCSGTDFYNLFSSLAIGADGFCDGGKINVNGTLYTVTRLTKAANSITFYTSGGVVTVNKFQEGTNVGVYTELAVTQAIKFQTVAGGIEVKHIFPWGTQAGSPGTYDIGTANERFNTAWLNYLDIKGKPPLLTKSLNGYPGMVHSDGTDSNWLRTPSNGLIPYASGGASALGTSSWPFNNGYFKSLNVDGAIVCTTINTGHGANEVFKISNERLTANETTVNMSAMAVGEIRFVSATLICGSGSSNKAYLRTPSGGSYVVVGYGGATLEAYIENYTSGNTEIANNTNEYTTRYFNGIVRRI